MKIEDRNSEKKPFRFPFFAAARKRGLVNDEPPETELVQNLAKVESERMGAHHIIAPKEKELKNIKKSEAEELKSATSKLRDKALNLFIKYKALVDKRIADKDRARTVDDIVLACRFASAREAWNHLNLAMEELQLLIDTYEDKDKEKNEDKT